MQHLTILTLVFLFIGCSATSTEKSPSQIDEKKPIALSGKKIFQQYCVLCHGSDGTLGLNGSKDLTISTTPMDSVIDQIMNGKGAMLAYKNTLSKAEIDSVANYVLSLRIK